MLENFLDPTILCFIAGLFAGVVKTDLRLPESTYDFVSMYLLLAIGFKGGVRIAGTPMMAIWPSFLGATCVGIITPIMAFAILRWLGRFDRANAASIAAHYGSISVVTFATAMTYLKAQSISFEPYVTALTIFLEIPAIGVGIFLARGGFKNLQNKKKLFYDIFLGKGIFLLGGGLIIGFTAGPERMKPLEPLFVDLFKGFLAFFLLELGVVTARQLAHLKKAGMFLFFFAIFMPILSGGVGIVIANLAGMSLGGTTLLAVLAASSSYIVAPSAMRMAVPEADPTLSLTPSLAITFPFNLTLGIPLFHFLAQLCQ